MGCLSSAGGHEFPEAHFGGFTLPGTAQKTDALSLLSLRNGLAVDATMQELSHAVDLRGYSVGDTLSPFAGFLMRLCLSSVFSQLCSLYQRCSGKYSVGLGCHLLVINKTSKFNPSLIKRKHHLPMVCFVCAC